MKVTQFRIWNGLLLVRFVLLSRFTPCTPRSEADYAAKGAGKGADSETPEMTPEPQLGYVTNKTDSVVMRTTTLRKNNELQRSGRPRY